MIVGRGRCTPVTGRPGRRPSSPVWANFDCPRSSEPNLALRLLIDRIADSQRMVGTIEGDRQQSSLS
jgi:hypothetical protein